MNQKRITNQILEQKNFTLNSTLNYLFNISNMKKLFSYLLISSMVVLSSCTNYDDQFDDLNTQINSLKSQIEGFSSLSSGLTALQGTVSSLQSAVAALPKTATPATDISGLEASVAALQTSLASASTSAEVTAITTQLTAAQAALADAIAANATAANANATSIAGNATAIANLLTELGTLATSLTAIKADLAAADTSAEVNALTLALAAAQADLSTILAQNNIYTGDVIINNAATLAAVEQLGDKVGIVNGNVYITQSSTTVDATKLQVIASKFVTVTGSVSYTHSGTGVTAVNFDKLSSAGSVEFNTEAPVSLPLLASAGGVTITNDPKVTSISMPVLASVTSFNDGTTANYLGGDKVTSIDLGALARYDVALGALRLTLSLTGDTTLDLASLTTTDKTDNTIIEKLDLTVIGGDDLTLPLFVKGDVTAANVKSFVAPKMIYTGATYGSVSLGQTKLETLAMHEMRGALDLTGFTKLASVDFIGTMDSTSNDQSVLGDIDLDGNTSLTTASFAGKLKKVYINGAQDLTSVTTAGMIRDFTINNSDDLTSLTLGHAGVSGITNKRDENASNATSLRITDNDALTSFSAEEIASLGTLVVTGNDALTAFTLKSTLSLGTALDTDGTADPEVVNVQINDNALTGTVQLPSALNVLPVVAGKVTNASLNAIADYLAAAEAAIKTPAVLDADGDLTAGWDFVSRIYAGLSATGAGAGGVASTAFASVAVDVALDEVTSILNSEGVAQSIPSGEYELINNDAKTAGLAQLEAQVKDTEFFSAGTNAVVSVKGGTQVTLTTTALEENYVAAFNTFKSNSTWAGYNVTVDGGIANRRTEIAIAGIQPTATDSVTLTWGNSGQYSVTYPVAAGDIDGGGDAAALLATQKTIAAKLAQAFNDYQTNNSTTASATIVDAVATVTPKDGGTPDAIIRIYTGTHSGTSTFKYSPVANAFFSGISVSEVGGMTFTVTNKNDYYVTATSSTSATTAVADLALVVSGPSVITSATATTTDSQQIDALTNNADGTLSVISWGTGNYLNPTHRVTRAGTPTTPADVTKRAAWLD